MDGAHTTNLLVNMVLLLGVKMVMMNLLITLSLMIKQALMTTLSQTIALNLMMKLILMMTLPKTAHLQMTVLNLKTILTKIPPLTIILHKMILMITASLNQLLCHKTSVVVTVPGLDTTGKMHQLVLLLIMVVYLPLLMTCRENSMLLVLTKTLLILIWITSRTIQPMFRTQ